MTQDELVGGSYLSSQKEPTRDLPIHYSLNYCNQNQLDINPLPTHLNVYFPHPPTLGYVHLVHILGSKVLFTIGPCFFDWIS